MRTSQIAAIYTEKMQGNFMATRQFFFHCTASPLANLVSASSHLITSSTVLIPKTTLFSHLDCIDLFLYATWESTPCLVSCFANACCYCFHLSSRRLNYSNNPRFAPDPFTNLHLSCPPEVSTREKCSSSTALSSVVIVPLTCMPKRTTLPSPTSED